MAGSSSNNGSQAVTIYNSQQLSSAYGNNILRNIIQPGVYDCTFSLSATPPNPLITVTINPGSTFVFRRNVSVANSPDQSNSYDVFIKVTLQTSATVTFNASTINSNIAYVTADYTYTDSSSDPKYALFNVTSVNPKELENTGTTHVVTLGTILNISNIWSTSSSGQNIVSSLNYYAHISYDSEFNRNTFTRNFTYNQQFNIEFDPSGAGVYVGPGTISTADGIINWLPTFGTSAPNQSYYSSYPTKNGTYEGIISPALGLTTYTASALTNSTVSIIGSEVNYYQVDFLRAKIDEVTHNTVIVWESFIIPSSTIAFSSTGGSWVSSYWTNAWPTVMTASNSVITPVPTTSIGPANTKNALWNYISKFNYNLTGSGVNLMVAVRPRGGTNNTWYTSNIPTTTTNNILWPESCFILKDIEPFQVTPSTKHSRMKIPVSTVSALGI